jgi:hypothetical protein
MTSTMNEQLPGAKAEAAVEAPGARESPPELAAPHASSEPDLESRIRRRRAELIGKLRELRAGVGLEVVQTRDKVKAKLSELAHIVKEGVVDGWTSVGDAVKHKLEGWLSESERSLTAQDRPTKGGRA